VNWEQIDRQLKQTWGYDRLYPAQSQVIESILQGNDTIAIMPTGSGKSLCFQLPALLQKGLTIVVSPLIALMSEQVKDLQSKHVATATIHSNLSSSERYQVLRDLPSLKLLYVSPETLLSGKVWQRLCQRDIEVAGLIIDEAHCLVQWGSSFRPAYRRLGAVRQALTRYQPDSPKSTHRITIAAFTATADRSTQAEIARCLELDNPHIVNLSPYRQNLSLSVAIAWTPLCRKQMALKFINQQRDQTGKISTGLVYVRTRRTAESLMQWLFDRLFADRQSQITEATDQSIPIAAYHAGLPALERRQIEQDWLIGKVAIVVCTSAFGLGINNPDLRWVLHFQPPLTLSEYVQETGRAGRDGNPATALLLVSEPTGILDQSDRRLHTFFQKQQQDQRNQALTMVQQIPESGNYVAVCCNLAGNDHKKGDRMALGLAILHSMGKLVWRDPHNYELIDRAISNIQESSSNRNHKRNNQANRDRNKLGSINHLTALLSNLVSKIIFTDKFRTASSDNYQQAIAQIQAYVTYNGCRWAFILAAFGVGNPDQVHNSIHQDRSLNQDMQSYPIARITNLHGSETMATNLASFKCGHCDRCLARAFKF
jgi:ATP-dependent DNA helicase RecQ